MAAGVVMAGLFFFMLVIGVPVIAVIAFSKLKASKEEGITKRASFADNIMTALGSIVLAVMIIAFAFLLIIAIMSLFITSLD